MSWAVITHFKRYSSYRCFFSRDSVISLCRDLYTHAAKSNSAAWIDIKRDVDTMFCPRLRRWPDI